ncbi:Mpo1 family 2-hydroxy fatty acid dioxygenase [Pseudokordiimonas caeni]|uniref:Mpo1 family 2-hydroxy fatty acid dioxygenase n=1 Tax=Pseudokordiimonas caeni TaxID=2997908 RepID=UPI002810C97C|nr:Mpo1-like protein [Pseudokordiimonas caeni]
MREWFLDQLAMYAAYHRDKRNEATHHLGVPMIVFSLMVLMAPVRLVEFEVGALTLAGLMIGLLLLYYVLMAPLVGIVAVLLYGALLYGAEHLAGYGTGFAVKSFAGLFVVGWIIQFVGHYFEGRRPALFTNLTQIFMAPAFLIAEILFRLGLEKGLLAEIEARKGRFLPAGEQQAAE